MFARIPRPPELDDPPSGGRVYPICNHFEDQNGRATLSIWFDKGPPSLVPLYSFQIYVTAGASPTQTSEREALGSALWNDILGNTPFSKRLDLHFLRPGEGNTDIMESHRALVRAEQTADLAKVVVPSYRYPDNYDYHSLVFIVSDPDWKQFGLKGLYFDPDPSDSTSMTEPVLELDLVGDEIETLTISTFNFWELREEYLDLFDDAKNSGITEWQDVFEATNRLGMVLV
ncbi:uncharacterized protein J3D65DRAFT_611854 [Phyllosticta citribraziliensis]|uniref:Uncharacterized protein n=1 Tax=Phyllosticta citribraziliensis TaxID=989973 RepID=A0ABR1MCW3_9PEZI